MASIVKSNVSLVVSNNQAKRAEFFDGVARAMNRAEMLFISKIQAERMHRQSTGVGTNVRTGMLRRDWFNATIRQNQAIQALVWSTTPYAPELDSEGFYVVPGHPVAAHTRRKKKGGTTVVKAHAVGQYWVHHKNLLQIGVAWEKDFLPLLEKEIVAMAAKTFQ